MSETSGWVDLVELTAAQSSANTQLLVHDGDEAGDPKEKYMTRAEARKMILQAMQYFASLTPAADKLPYFDGATSGALADLTAAGRALIGAASAAAQLAALGGAPLASPALTGTPTTTTAAGSDNSDRIASTAQVQAAIALAVTGVFELKGNTDGSGNPNYPAGSVGDLYYCSVAGKIGGGSGKSIEVGDAIVCKTDNAGGNEAAVGTSWFVLEHNLAGALLAANNLSDLANAAMALANIGGIGKAIVDAKGDLIAGTAADTVARLPVGTNGQVLKANSGTSTGLEWADESGGGGAVDMSTCALLAPAADGGNDGTAVLGDFTKPFATAQAAWAAGASSLELLPNASSYGAISSSGAPILLSIFSHPRADGGVNQLGNIASGGASLTLINSGGANTFQTGNIDTTAVGGTAGTLILSGIYCAGNVYTSGVVGFGNGGNVSLINGTHVTGSVESKGGMGVAGSAAGDSGATGGSGAGNVFIEDSKVDGAVNAVGANGGDGASGNEEISGGSGGGGGSGGNVTIRRSTVAGVVYVDGGSGGSGGADGGIGGGSGGSGGNAGTVKVTHSTVAGVSAAGNSGGGGSSSGSPGAGGTVTVSHSDSGGVSVIDGTGSASGTVIANFATVTTTGAASKSGFYVVDAGTPYDTYA